MMKSRDFKQPSTMEELFALLEAFGPHAAILAGGTDLMVAGRSGIYAGRVLVDITGLAQLRGIRQEGEEIVIGALTSLSDIEKSPLIQEKAGALALGARSAGSPQIRNRGTIGGNICNASPAADTLPALVALDAEVKLARAGAVRTLPLAEFILGAYKTRLAPDEVAVEVRFKAPAAGTASRFFKVGRRNALAISRLTVAAFLAVGTDGKVAHVALAPGAVFNRPARLADAEAALLGKEPTAETIDAAVVQASKAIVEAIGNRWSTPYKHPVCVNLCRRALTQMAEEVR